MWIDAHNHLQFHRPQEWDGVMKQLAAQRVGKCVVNGTCEADWEGVAQLALRYPEVVEPSFGVHPWRVNELAVGWEGRLRERLEQFPQAGVGEIGLDGGRGQAGMAAQLSVWKLQMEVAHEYGRAVSVHVVKAWPEVMRVLVGGKWERVLLHGFQGSREVLLQLAKESVWFSVGLRGLKAGEAWEQRVRQVPMDRMLFESDGPGEWSEGGVRRVVDEYARSLGVREDELAARVEKNFWAWWRGAR